MPNLIKLLKHPDAKIPNLISLFKDSDFEYLIQFKDRSVLSDLSSADPDWVKQMIDRLSPEDLSLLYAIGQAHKFQLRGLQRSHD